MSKIPYLVQYIRACDNCGDTINDPDDIFCTRCKLKFNIGSRDVNEEKNRAVVDFLDESGIVFGTL